MIGQLKYGPPLMSVQADRTQQGSLSRVAWDDERLPIARVVWIEKGILRNLAYIRFWAQKQGVTPTGGVALAASRSAADRRAPRT